jgi:transporter family-2 protein
MSRLTRRDDVARDGRRQAAGRGFGTFLRLALCAGAGVSLQSFTNGHLTDELGSPLLAAATNNLSAIALIAVLAILTGALPRAARAVAERRTVMKPWWFAGGLLGAVAVASVSYAAPLVGMALLTVALVLGQLLGALVADLLGLGPAGRKRVTALRVLGVVVALGAVAVGAIGRSGNLELGVLAIAMLGGAAASVQQAGNGQLTRLTGEPLAMALLNFVVGFLVLTVVIASFGGASFHAVRQAMPWWAWVGGAVGTGIAVVLSVAVRRLGVLQMMLCVVAGQSVSALALDLAVPRAGHEVTAGAVVGVALACVAMAVAAEWRVPVHDVDPHHPEPGTVQSRAGEKR